MISGLQHSGGLRRGRLLRAALVLLLGALEIACNENYRPIVQPVLPPPPNPAAFHYVIALTTNGPLDPGSASRIDVSGDTYSGVFKTGVVPTHAALVPSGNKLYVANVGEDTVSVNNVSSPTIVSAISLPAGSQPVFVHSTENGNMYVANYGNSTVSQINTTSDVVIGTVSVGNQPVAMAEMPNAQKLYVVNQGSGTVSSINISGFSVAKTIPVGSAPVWAVARSDNAKIYVLDNSGTIYEIDTLSDTVLGTSSSAGAGSNFMAYDRVAQRLYVTNPSNGRIAILDSTTDPPAVVSTQLNISAALQTVSNTTYTFTQVSGPTPQIGMNLVLNGMVDRGNNGTFAVSAVGSGTFTVVNGSGVTRTGQSGSGFVTPCLDCSPVSVTGLGDGSRAYVSSYQLVSCGGSPCVSTQVAVINAGNNTISKVIPLDTVPVDTTNPANCAPPSGPPAATPWTPGTARFRAFAAASGGGTTTNFKVYVSQCDAGSVAVIDTSAVSTGSSPHPADTYTVTLAAPLSSFAPASNQNGSGAVLQELNKK